MESDAEFLGTLLRPLRRAPEKFSDAVTCHLSANPLSDNNLTGDGKKPCRHLSDAANYPDCETANPDYPDYCGIPQLTPCASCAGRFFWVSPRCDTHCYRCRPPKRNSATFVRQRLIIDDDGLVEDFDAALAASSGATDLQSAPARLLRPQRPKRGGAGEPGPPPGMSIDAWWESLIDPDQYFRAVAACRELAK